MKNPTVFEVRMGCPDCFMDDHDFESVLDNSTLYTTLAKAQQSCQDEWANTWAEVHEQPASNAPPLQWCGTSTSTRRDDGTYVSYRATDVPTDTIYQITELEVE